MTIRQNDIFMRYLGILGKYLQDNMQKKLFHIATPLKNRSPSNHENWLVELREWAYMSKIPETEIPYYEDDLSRMTHLVIYRGNRYDAGERHYYHYNFSKIDYLPDAIGGLLKLKHMDLCNNLLFDLPVTIKNLQQLRTINISCNAFQYIPKEIYSLTQLEYLNLSDNKLLSLPTQIGQLGSLQEIWLNDNHIDKIPASIGNLKQLKRLFIAGNELRKVPTEIGRLSRLEVLCLNDNKLQILPAVLGHLRHLKYLDLKGNPLCCLPKRLKKLYWEKQGDLKISLDNKQLLRYDHRCTCVDSLKRRLSTWFGY